MRFYEVHDESNSIKISSEIKPEKSSNERIIGGTFNIRQGSQRLTNQADPKKMYELIRRRSEDKKCKENSKKLCRTTTFIMPLHEYNFTNKEIRTKKSFQLLHENIIVHYDVVGDLENFDNSASHGNTKRTQVFRPTIHSVKQNVKRFCLLPQNHRGL